MGDQVQAFTLTGSFPHAFQITTQQGDCMLPVGTGETVFDAVAFQTPYGDIRVVAMNLKDKALKFDIYDATAKGGYRDIDCLRIQSQLTHGLRRLRVLRS